MLDEPRQSDSLVVVGSLHLLGNDGLVERLRAKGYTVERVCSVCTPTEGAPADGAVPVIGAERAFAAKDAAKPADGKRGKDKAGKHANDKHAAGEAEAIKPEPTKPEPAKPEPAKSEPAKLEPVK
jgi:hypothetical protein